MTTLPIMLNVQQVAKRLGVGTTLAGALMRSGRIPALKLGRRRMVSVAGLDQWIAEETERVRDRDRKARGLEDPMPPGNLINFAKESQRR